MKSGKVGGDGGPGDDVPPSGNVVGAAVLIFKVVGMLPDVQTQNGSLAGGEGAVLIGRRRNGKSAGGVS